MPSGRKKEQERRHRGKKCGLYRGHSLTRAERGVWGGGLGPSQPWGALEEPEEPAKALSGPGFRANYMEKFKHQASGI